MYASRKFLFVNAKPIFQPYDLVCQLRGSMFRAWKKSGRKSVIGSQSLHLTICSCPQMNCTRTWCLRFNTSRFFIRNLQVLNSSAQFSAVWTKRQRKPSKKCIVIYSPDLISSGYQNCPKRRLPKLYETVPVQ